MKLWGFFAEGEQDKPESLSDVTIQANPEELRAISRFLLKCADEIESMPAGWEHEHFADNRDDDGECFPDIIVFNGLLPDN